jgi:hypothetical protein
LTALCGSTDSPGIRSKHVDQKSLGANRRYGDARFRLERVGALLRHSSSLHSTMIGKRRPHGVGRLWLGLADRLLCQSATLSAVVCQPANVEILIHESRKLVSQRSIEGIVANAENFAG